MVSPKYSKITQLLQKDFNGKLLNLFSNPDEAVPYGVAGQSAALSGGTGSKFLDFGKTIFYHSVRPVRVV